MTGYPTRLEDLSGWAKSHGKTAGEARTRFVQFVVLLLHLPPSSQVSPGVTTPSPQCRLHEQSERQPS